MKLIDEIIKTLPQGKVIDVRIGLHWTIVEVEVEGERRSGLSATLRVENEHRGIADVPDAGKLINTSALDLADFAQSDHPTRRSLGIAAINALLPKDLENWRAKNALQVIRDKGKDKRVALVGRFHFVPKLRHDVGELFVLERRPREGDLPAEEAARIIPTADVVAITGMTIVNHSIEELLGYCSPRATVLLLGPSTPLSPVFFDYGVNLLSGSVVIDIQPVRRTVVQGGNFRQVRHAGMRLVTIGRKDF
jgi:uncharacterized protein